MFCKYCGQEISSNVKFCKSCGRNIGSDKAYPEMQEEYKVENPADVPEISNSFNTSKVGFIENIKKYTGTAFSIGCLLLFAWYYYSYGGSGSPNCDSQVKYSMGTIDPAFNLNKDNVINLSKQAGDIWNKALGKELYIYDENAPIKINFIYEQRQKDRDEIKQKMNSLNLQYGSLTELNNKINNLITAYQNDLNNYNSQIDYWNSRGGAPNYTYNNLKKWGNNIENQRVYINNLINAYNSSQDNYNFSVETFNDMVNQKRNNLEEEGIHVPSNNGSPEVINIYVYDGDDSLKYLLTHELGHVKANHAANNDSIMNPVINDAQLKNLSPTEEDINLVKSCKGN